MTRTLTALAVAATVFAASVATPNSAEARGRGAAVAAGIIGGIAAGALIAGSGHAFGAPYYAYGPRPYYYYRPYCHWRRERVWDGWGWRRTRVRVCYDD